MAADILIVDDEKDIRELIAGILDDEGFDTRTAHDADSALDEVSARRPNLLILDIWLQGSRLDGLALLAEIKLLHPDLPVVIISGHGNIETAVAAIKRGAYDYVEKPFKADRLILVTERAIETFRLKETVQDLQKRTDFSAEIVGTTPVINQLNQTIEKIAPTNSRILIVGPSGSGKGLVARSLHSRSLRAASAFVEFCPSGLSEEDCDLQLFGQEISGQPQQTGILERAHGGTLFLDEVGDLPLACQAKLLRVLVGQTFNRVGGATPVKCDVRVFASTSQNLEESIANGLFREDLYHRLSVVPVRIPGLAERRDDIPMLVELFVAQICATSGLAPRKIGEDAMAVLQAHDWPGNARQLRNNIERLLILTRSEPDATISADLLPSEVGTMLPSTPSGSGGDHLMSLPLRDAREVFERDYLLAQINRFGGNISKTAEFVGMERSALHRKLKSLGL
jgi:two-component system nitrogen regulation response regulator NtrX